jgi:hypothetical protein
LWFVTAWEDIWAEILHPVWPLKPSQGMIKEDLDEFPAALEKAVQSAYRIIWRQDRLRLI